jgi:hypothetical protein
MAMSISQQQRVVLEGIGAEDIAKLVDLLKRKGHTNAADFVEQFFDGEADESQVANELAEVLPICGFSGKVKWVSWEIHNHCQQIVSERNMRPFLSPLLEALFRLNNEAGSRDSISFAEAVLGRARSAERWAGWSKKALEHMIVKDKGSLKAQVGVDLFRSALDAHNANFQGATVLIDGLIKAIRVGVEEHQKAKRQAKIKKDAERQGHQLERARLCQGMKGSNPGVEKHGKGKKKSKR